MSVHADTLVVQTRGRGFTEITGSIADVLSAAPIANGLVNVFIQHTSASLIVNENADPDVRRDFESWFSRLVKDGDSIFRHRDEGDDDMSAHIRSVLTTTSLNVPVRAGRLALGTWQGIYLWEHRAHPHRRRVLITVLGE